MRFRGSTVYPKVAACVSYVLQACLQDLRSRLVDMANIIQGRFEQETENLQRKQDWYKSNQGSLTKEEESDYTTFCKDKMFTIHILEERLKRWVYSIHIEVGVATKVGTAWQMIGHLFPRSEGYPCHVLNW